MASKRFRGWFCGSILSCALLMLGVPRSGFGGAPTPGWAGGEAGVRFAERPGRLELSGRLVVRPLTMEARRVQVGDHAEAVRRDALARARIAPHAVRYVGETDEYLVRVPPGLADGGYAHRLLRTRDYAYVEPDWIVHPARTPDDPLLMQQWRHVRIESAQAWELTVGSASVVCAVCDTGVDLAHPDLAPVLVEGASSVGLGPVVAQSQGGDVWDANGHGTLVAGCLAAAGNNGVGVVGGGWVLGLMPVRVSGAPDGSAPLSDITQGARWAAEQGARIINCSYEGVSSASVQATGEYVSSLGGVLFWAAGNFGQNWTTFDHEDVVVVGATDQGDARPAFSAFGPGVDVFAPGVDVYTTVLGGGYGAASGTSFASAVAAGVGALAWSRSPELTPAEVRHLVCASSDDLGVPGEDDEWGWGRVNALEAVLGADPPQGPPGPFELVSPAQGAVDVSATPVLDWSESADAGYYRVLLDDDPLFASPEIDTTVFGTTLPVDPGVLEFETTYRWTVVAQNFLGEETWEPQVASFTTEPLPAPASFGLVSPAPGSTDVATGPTLSWGESALAASYEVVVSESADLSAPLVVETVAAPQGSLTLEEGTLGSGRMYYWGVTASNDAGSRASEPGVATFETAPVPPPAAFALLAPVNGSTGVPTGPTLAWEGSAYAEEYVVEVDESPMFADVLVSEIVPAPDIVVVLAPGTLAYETAYYWRVRAVNTSGERVSGPSVSAFTTVAPPPPPCVGDVDGDGITSVFDFAILAGNFGVESGASRREGDLNADERVDVLDFGLLADDFGCGL